MAEYWNAPRSGVKAYSEEPIDGEPQSLTAYFKTGAYTYTRQSVGDANFENMINLAHDGIGLCRYITANCRNSYVSKVGGSVKPKGGSAQQTSARLKGYWDGSRIESGNTYNLDNRTKHSLELSNKLTSLPSGVSRNNRGNGSNSNELVNYWANSHASSVNSEDANKPLPALPSGVTRNKRGNQSQPAKPRIKLKSSHVASASRASPSKPKPRIKLKTRK